MKTIFTNINIKNFKTILNYSAGYNDFDKILKSVTRVICWMNKRFHRRAIFMTVQPFLAKSVFMLKINFVTTGHVGSP
jgi:hypothetical protein